MIKPAEYNEGPEAGRNFKRLATALFQAPKNGRKATKKRQPKKATSRKSRGSDKG
jgi:hypothetical protein